ncbi:uncharacterized protein AMSG_09811 [Thecamonas trahens ATCC 50062]|uniref:CobW C-terminal domain-containing protein n=1 Tax=Thecamonas trahens ATCC 50062 TaxID=461836 RepID=A0A0L0DNL4_THETB|nr:hypothetical protein AMSG_09811 [Thecamonas trahens ATCC 50062]KNC53860.1 hypothetical protein AMSG_09811 [Thecamonas trahens ATCC 50062]|eukprot:XP_013754240.1 hypothetical protein AMSG_09811 [Thecamonas trahens ATCC 50062]
MVLVADELVLVADELVLVADELVLVAGKLVLDGHPTAVDSRRAPSASDRPEADILLAPPPEAHQSAPPRTVHDAVLDALLGALKAAAGESESESASDAGWSSSLSRFATERSTRRWREDSSSGSSSPQSPSGSGSSAAPSSVRGALGILPSASDCRRDGMSPVLGSFVYASPADSSDFRHVWLEWTGVVPPELRARLLRLPLTMPHLVASMTVELIAVVDLVELAYVYVRGADDHEEGSSALTRRSPLAGYGVSTTQDPQLADVLALVAVADTVVVTKSDVLGAQNPAQGLVGVVQELRGSPASLFTLVPVPGGGHGQLVPFDGDAAGPPPLVPYLAFREFNSNVVALRFRLPPLPEAAHGKAPPSPSDARRRGRVVITARFTRWLRAATTRAPEPSSSAPPQIFSVTALVASTALPGSAWLVVAQGEEVVRITEVAFADGAWDALRIGGTQIGGVVVVRGWHCTSAGLQEAWRATRDDDSQPLLELYVVSDVGSLQILADLGVYLAMAATAAVLIAPRKVIGLLGPTASASLASVEASLPLLSTLIDKPGAALFALLLTILLFHLISIVAEVLIQRRRAT